MFLNIKIVIRTHYVSTPSNMMMRLMIDALDAAAGRPHDDERRHETHMTCFFPLSASDVATSSSLSLSSGGPTNSSQVMAVDMAEKMKDEDIENV